MRQLRVLIVDDETPARDRLRRLLSTEDYVAIVGEANDGAQAVEAIERYSPDLVFLDVQMPGLDGFGVIQALDTPPAIIFVTAYDEYAIRAFEVHALDYLLKPFSKERLTGAIHRAQEALDGERDWAAQLGPLLENLTTQGRYLDRLAVHDRGRIRLLDVKEVDWIGAEDDQVMVHVNDRTFLIRRTLANLEAQLDPTRFFRAHRSAIVNLDRVKEIIPWFKGSYVLRLTTGAKVDLSRSQARTLRKILNW
ncbi:MAG: response regulator transcription factor [Anaerolineales bacterium]|nr:response regulator transcription factor [Anaerolineales bacterium]